MTAKHHHYTHFLTLESPSDVSRFPILQHSKTPSLPSLQSLRSLRSLKSLDNSLTPKLHHSLSALSTFFFKKQLVIIHPGIFIETLFYPLTAAMHVYVEVLVQLNHTF